MSTSSKMSHSWSNLNLNKSIKSLLNTCEVNIFTIKHNIITNEIRLRSLQNKTFVVKTVWHLFKHSYQMVNIIPHTPVSVDCLRGDEPIFCGEESVFSFFSSFVLLSRLGLTPAHTHRQYSTWFWKIHSQSIFIQMDITHLHITLLLSLLMTFIKKLVHD